MTPDARRTAMRSHDRLSQRRNAVRRNAESPAEVDRRTTVAHGPVSAALRPPQFGASTISGANACSSRWSQGRHASGLRMRCGQAGARRCGGEPTVQTKQPSSAATSTRTACPCDTSSAAKSATYRPMPKLGPQPGYSGVISAMRMGYHQWRGASRPHVPHRSRELHPSDG